MAMSVHGGAPALRHRVRRHGSPPVAAAVGEPRCAPLTGGPAERNTTAMMLQCKLLLSRHDDAVPSFARATFFTAVCALCVGSAAPAAAQPADFSGLYFPSRGRTVSPQPPEYTPAAKQALERSRGGIRDRRRPGTLLHLARHPARDLGGVGSAIEIQQRAQDLTIYWEGYGMYRKIYVAERAPPEPVLPSAMGHSVARWEGSYPRHRHHALAAVSVHEPNGDVVRRPRSWSACRVEERVVDGEMREFVVDEVVLTDPKVYTTPIKITATLQERRDARHPSSTPAAIRCGTSTSERRAGSRCPTWTLCRIRRG